MTEIICLANSLKMQERCIAGINPATGHWVRPICSQYPDDGRVPSSIRLINNQEPSLLDIIDIPLEATGNNFGFESENLTIAPGKWKKIKSLAATDLLEYCSETDYILHNSSKYVTVDYLQSLPSEKSLTLQLIYAEKLLIKEQPGSMLTATVWKGSIINQQGQQLTDVNITDPAFIEQLETDYRPSNPCLVTVSLSMPYRPPNWKKEDAPCWKLIAGVIELSDIDLILVEMKRLGWTIDQGRNYLQKHYQKCSRSLLTNDEIQEFLSYLKYQ
ncbi:hypothetical protein [Crocosphaera sp.]|uniref:dual OB domain-containing protein n=1 Tax=Crocosphaera sp. TaxID=2729996 RepID=UPI00260B7BBB|nr:hypothetical protein [Crocosphaera sp.]MDJ0581511.1 hypothetical protein [Crocosphaera sp.]